MRLKDHLSTGLKALRPNKYRELTALPLRRAFAHLFVMLSLSILLLLLIGIPALLNLKEAIANDLSSFTTLSISIEAEADEPIALLTYPLVLVDLHAKNTTHPRVLLTEEGVQVKRLFFRGLSFTPWSTFQDAAGNPGAYASVLSWLFILLLPSFILLLFVGFLIEGLLLALITWILALLFTRVLRFSIGAGALLKTVLFALTPFYLIQAIPFLYVRMFLLPIILYLLLVIIAVWSAGESAGERTHRRSTKGSDDDS